MNIYIGNLLYSSTEDELREHFEQYGEVEKVTVIQDRDTGQSKGFAFIEMPDDVEAKVAIEELDGRDFQGRNIKVNKSEPKKKGGFQRGRR